MKKNLLSLAMSLTLLMSAAAQAQTTHLTYECTLRIHRRECPTSGRQL